MGHPAVVAIVAVVVVLDGDPSFTHENSENEFWNTDGRSASTPISALVESTAGANVVYQGRLQQDFLFNSDWAEIYETHPSRSSSLRPMRIRQMPQCAVARARRTPPSRLSETKARSSENTAEEGLYELFFNLTTVQHSFCDFLSYFLFGFWLRFDVCSRIVQSRPR